jgi:predicted alpha/beta-hydrolase family hydrolase
MSGVAGVVLFPGAGSSAQHSSLIATEASLAPLPVSRVDFPYRIAGKSFPDKTPVLVTAVKTAVRDFATQLGVATTSLVIGGRSMGGRMCSMAVADTDDPLEVAGLVLVSYPLHPPKKPENLRVSHLPDIHVPVLCISGTRDTFGTPEELQSAFGQVSSDVVWHWVNNARHELARADDEVAQVTTTWVKQLAIQA